MIKQFLMKKVLERQLKDVPEAQRTLILTMVEKDPELFQKIAAEIKAEMKKGKDQQTAAFTVIPKYQAQIQKLMGNPQRIPQQFNPNGSIRK